MPVRNRPGQCFKEARQCRRNSYLYAEVTIAHISPRCLKHSKWSQVRILLPDRSVGNSSAVERYTDNVE